MNGAVSVFIEFVARINNLLGKLLRLVRFLELLTDCAVVLDASFNQLVNTKIKHVVLNSKVGASSVDWELFLMVYDNNLSTEAVSQILQSSFQ